MGHLSILCVIWKGSQVNRKSNIKVKEHNVHYLFLHTLASTRKMIKSHHSLLQMSILPSLSIRSKERCWLSCDWQIEPAYMSQAGHLWTDPHPRQHSAFIQVPSVQRYEERTGCDMKWCTEKKKRQYSKMSVSMLLYIDYFVQNVYQACAYNNEINFTSNMIQ